MGYGSEKMCADPVACLQSLSGLGAIRVCQAQLTTESLSRVYGVVGFTGTSFVLSDVVVVDRVIRKLNRVVLLEPVADVVDGRGVVRRGRVQQHAPFRLAQVPFLEDHAAAMDHDPRQLEHPLLVLAGGVDRHVGVGSDTQMPLVGEAQHAGGGGPRDDGDLVERVLALQIPQTHPSRTPGGSLASTSSRRVRSMSSAMICG